MGAPVRIGEVVADKYEVTKILGSGGMGIVVAARHRELDKLVALKFIHEEPALAPGSEATERFLQEARVAARFQNEHVVRVLDLGRLSSGVPFIAMEYLEGENLAQLLERDGPLEVSDAAEYMLQVCDAMAEAHGQEIIHRDLKPDNLFLTTRPDGRRVVKVLDFGISKAHFLHGKIVTSRTLGTPQYMAPEQIRTSGSVDARADIWSLGVILYQLLTNTLPFAGDSPERVIFKVLFEHVPPLATGKIALPAGLVGAIHRCLEKDRARRFCSVAELANELVPFTRERARAALSLIERVMTAGAPPRHPAELDAEAPSMPGPDMVSVRDVGPQRWSKWIAIAGSFLVAITVIAMARTTSGGLARPGSSALVTDGESHATLVPGDAAIATQVEAPDASTEAVADVQVDKQPAAVVDRKRPASRLRIRRRIDAGVPEPDASTLEPVQDEESLIPVSE